MNRLVRCIDPYWILILSILSLLIGCQVDDGKENPFITHEVDPRAKNLRMFWGNDAGENFKNAKNLKNELENKGYNLLFAVNGGMYKPDRSPQGLYIEQGEIHTGLDREKSEYGNFYMQPNGVFYIMKDKSPFITTTGNFVYSQEIEYATQSGPMLISKGKINILFNEKSTNVNIRNGVGILPNGNVFFAQSKVEVNFYEFAQVFSDRGCENALYLDGYVSRTYLPEQGWEQLDGDFGVMIAVIE